MGHVLFGYDLDCLFITWRESDQVPLTFSTVRVSRPQIYGFESPDSDEDRRTTEQRLNKVNILCSYQILNILMKLVELH